MVDLEKIKALTEDFAVRIIPDIFVGPVLISVSSVGLMSLSIIPPETRNHFMEKTGSMQAEENVDLVTKQVNDYALGKLKKFSLPLDFSLATRFQQRVLYVTEKIPYGRVLTYGGVAERIGKPKAARAVGGALGRNPIGIVVPCHRVVAHNGHLHGFSSPDGIVMKAKLLRHEGLAVVDDRVVVDR